MKHDDLQHLNQELLIASARAMIQRGLALGQRPVVSTKFGPQSAVLLHLIVQEIPDIPVIWVDTGYNTRATVRYADLLKQRFNLNLQVFKPSPNTGLAIPPALDDPNHASFTQQVKLQPFARALENLQPDVWFSSLRREQTAFRAGLNFASRSEAGLIKIAPLLEWKQADMQAYLQHIMPTIEYSEEDYYDPTKGEPRRECGLHLNF